MGENQLQCLIAFGIWSNAQSEIVSPWACILKFTLIQLHTIEISLLVKNF